MGYELKREDIYGLAGKLNAITKTKGLELFFTYCPYCGGGSSKDKNTFSINLETGKFKCFRSGCGKQGHFVQMARDFGYPLEFTGQFRQRNYKKLPQTEVEVRPSAVEYLGSRGISPAIVERYKITSWKNRDSVIVFPFYDEDGILQFVKYRNTAYKDKSDGSKEWSEKDAMPILFGMRQCVDYETLVITEGQIDSLSLAEACIKNAVSVPTGAMGFTWVENCWDWITRFAEVIVFGDYENGKITLVDELSRRLPMPVRVIREEDYLGEKDANAILQKYGQQALIDAVSNAAIQPISHIKELADVETVDIYNLERIKTGIDGIDKVLGGMFFGQVVLLTGKRGEGKSTFMSQLIVEARNQGYKSLAYSGELTDYHFKRWMDFQSAGPGNVVTNRDTYGEETYLLLDSTVQKINDWYRGNVYIYDNNAIDGDEIEGLLKTIEKAIRRYGIQFVCLDNLMTAMDVSVSDNVFQAQSEFVRKLKQIAVKYNVAILLVAHPKKTQQGGISDADDVSGSADITNRVDVVMVYSRAKSDDEAHDSELKVLKNRLLGRLTRKGEEIQLVYNKSTKRIFEINGNSDKHYGWTQGTFVDLPDDYPLPF